MIVPVILAGGAGTRLWPLSRQLHPKQVLPITGQATMIQETLGRLEGLDGLAPPIVICNESHRFMIAEQLREKGIQPGAIVLEPVGRNTAPAIAVAALQASRQDQDPILLVLPADHHIGRPDRFRRGVAAGQTLAEAGRLVTFGIVPTRPETGYGYIKQGAPLTSASAENRACAIEAFVEKPDRTTAEGYLASGAYLWNSGMFLFPSSVLLAEMKRLVPEMVSACESALAAGREDLDFFRLDRAAFETCPADSIDYAVMEKTALGAMLPLLIAADMFSVYHHWGTWDRQNLKVLMPGSILGILAGAVILAWLLSGDGNGPVVSSDVASAGQTQLEAAERKMKMAIGVICVLYVVSSVVRARYAPQWRWKPSWWAGSLSGWLAGVVSTLAHAAGPVITIFLLGQHPTKQKFIGTAVVYFFIINTVKLIPYGCLGMIDTATLGFGLWLLPLVPVGTYAGAHLNRVMSEDLFRNVIMTIVFLTGVKMIMS